MCVCVFVCLCFSAYHHKHGMFLQILSHPVYVLEYKVMHILYQLCVGGGGIVCVYSYMCTPSTKCLCVM